MKKLKIGIIGCGGIAANKHLPHLSKFTEVELSAFSDSFAEKAQQAAEQFGTADAAVYTDYKQLLANSTIDVVHVCTSNDSHAEISIAALEAGKHVMCEKPMAICAADAVRMLETAKRTGKKLTIGYNNRFRSDSQQLHKVCRNGELGTIYFAKAHAIRRRGVPTRGVFLDKDKQGGGPLIDIGTHALDLTLWMMDNYKPKMVVGTAYHMLSQNNEAARNGGWDPKSFKVEDSAFGMIVMENGATIMLESSWALNIRQEGAAKVTLCGTKGGADMRDGLWINGEENGKLYDKEILMEGSGIPSLDKVRSKSIELEMRVWLDSVLYDQELVVKPEQALVVSQILEAVYESAETGKAVYFT
ncbi:Gfo/Idh/MocA family protein [Paenibacillus radicis (ex Xue et al. 2023)]|uniref:Gfo/Idh/MocA family oxidoreductase n=1 Tax=Paenibacillus radicis (ex Xue et al. 2023) TaxID=2972489 RepID=A0ABT1YL39_9BACL|nr:Gfo/Idh/MocA family oxidoreductase [Paenibacillus radicis (ex Xue et al. 2023)]MCR8632983.1 Gfo/Idh/MocA family oxidoreductase [Paenibacillus radicis (ex Xue et al. 2023)]